MRTYKYANRVVYPEISYKINGILFAVHNEVGKFRNEKQYSDAIENHLKTFKINYEREKALPPSFAGEVGGRNRIDFLVDGKIIVEVKTKRVIDREDYYQVKRYLMSLNKKLAILVNFRQKHLNLKRILNPSVSE